MIRGALWKKYGRLARSMRDVATSARMFCSTICSVDRRKGVQSPYFFPPECRSDAISVSATFPSDTNHSVEHVGKLRHCTDATSNP